MVRLVYHRHALLSRLGGSISTVAPPMPATVSKPIPAFSLLFVVFAGSTCLCACCFKCKSITHLFFSLWPSVVVNIVYFLVHVIDGLGVEVS